MKHFVLVAVVVAVLVPIGFTQKAAAAPPPEKARIFVSDSQSWSTRGSAGGSSDGWAGASSGGARPQTAEVIKTFGERCPGVVVNDIPERCDFVVLFDHEGGKGLLRHDNKIAVFERASGDAVFSKSTRSLGSAVKDACRAIDKDWQRSSARILSRRATVAPASTATAQTHLSRAASTTTKVAVTSKPESADIEVDGAFVGNTPSTIDLASGNHTVRVTKDGYQPYERRIRISGGSIHLDASLRPAH